MTWLHPQSKTWKACKSVLSYFEAFYLDGWCVKQYDISSVLWLNNRRAQRGNGGHFKVWEILPSSIQNLKSNKDKRGWNALTMLFSNSGEVSLTMAVSSKYYVYPHNSEQFPTVRINFDFLTIKHTIPTTTIISTMSTLTTQGTSQWWAFNLLSR